jgi:hypothetical protein
MPRQRWPARLLLAWGLLHLVGGFATVLPLPVWPFSPEQSVRHYAFHVLYAFTQLPLVALVRHEHRELRPVADDDLVAVRPSGSDRRDG